MKAETRRNVYNLLDGFAKSALKDYDLGALKKSYPFHRLFFDELALLAFKQERSIVTKMGMHLYPELARLIAVEKHKEVTREKAITGLVPIETANAIDSIVRQLRNNQRSPNRKNEISEINNTLSQKGKSEQTELKTIADIYIGDFTGGPFFAEIKTPLPNLDVCAETKQKILTFMTLRRTENPKAFMAFPYNPFITRAEYKHGFTNRIMDMAEDVLMGEEFWDYIGGNNTFKEIIDVIEEVGDEIRKRKKK